MDNIKKTNSAQVAFKWTLIYVVTSIVLIYVYQFLNISVLSPIRYITNIPFIAFMFLAQKERRDELGGFITFGDGFVTGLLYAVFAGILISIFTYIYYAILSPQVWQQFLDLEREALNQKNLSDDQIDAGLKFAGNVVFTSIGVLIGTPIIGAIISLIGAAIFKKEKSILDIERDASNYSDPVS